MEQSIADGKVCLADLGDDVASRLLYVLGRLAGDSSCVEVARSMIGLWMGFAWPSGWLVLGKDCE
jgi:hypothetical protein